MRGLLLRLVGRVLLPLHGTGGYDHADVDARSGKVYVAHTANGTVEVVDGEALRHLKTIAGCEEASGVLCARAERKVFAASRSNGKVLLIDCETDATEATLLAGSSPNGLAWDPRRGRLLVADVKENNVRLIDVARGEAVSNAGLPGRPRWASYLPGQDAFLVNIRDPPGVAVLSGKSGAVARVIPVAAQGPHGLEVDEGLGRAFVACDGRVLVSLDIASGEERGRLPLAGEPDVLWLNRRAGKLYCASGNPGVLESIDTGSLRVAESVKTEEGAHTFAFDEDRQVLYSLLPKSQCIGVYAES